MKIYQVFKNDSDFMIPHFEPDEIEEKRGDDDFILITRPKSYTKDWVPLELSFSISQSLPVIPTVSKWRSYLVMHESAYQALEGLLGPFGEFLPCSHQNIKFYLYNPLTIAEDLGSVVVGSVTRNGNLLSGIAFDEEKLKGIPVFRTKETYVSIYCNEIFKEAVQSKEFEGLLFSPNLTHY